MNYGIEVFWRDLSRGVRGLFSGVHPVHTILPLAIFINALGNAWELRSAASNLEWMWYTGECGTLVLRSSATPYPLHCFREQESSRRTASKHSESTTWMIRSKFHIKLSHIVSPKGLPMSAAVASSIGILSVLSGVTRVLAAHSWQMTRLSS